MSWLDEAEQYRSQRQQQLERFWDEQLPQINMIMTDLQKAFEKKGFRASFETLNLAIKVECIGATQTLLIYTLSAFSGTTPSLELNWRFSDETASREIKYFENTDQLRHYFIDRWSRGLI